MILFYTPTLSLSTISIFIFIGILTTPPTLVSSSKANLDTLRQAQILFRHGARTIDQTYPADPYYNESFWSPGYSQLTNLGKLQGYNLGLFLRQRYDGFVKDTYNLKDIYVLSSDLARTMQTVYSVLAGFYLPNQILLKGNETLEDYLRNNNSVEIPLPWKSVPVHTTPVEYDNIIRQQKKNCARYNQLFNNILRDQAEVAKFFEERNDTVQYINQHIGLDGLTEALRKMDTMLIERYYNLTLPNWTHQLFETEEATYMFYFYFQMLTFTNEMKRLRVGPLLERLVGNMILNTSSWDHFDRARTGQKKMYFFSGHDTTLTGLLDTLGIFNGNRPSFTAAIMLELHQSSSGDLDYVELHYRNETDGEPYQLQIPGCGVPCLLADFRSLVQPYIPADWNLECQALEEAEAQVLSTGWIILIILGFWIVLFVFMQVWVRARCFKFFEERQRKKSYTNLP